MASDRLKTQLTNLLATTHNLPVSPTWLATFLASTRQPLPPLQALASTARFRLLNSDIRSSLTTTNVLPSGINDVNAKELRLGHDVVVQVLDVTDIGTSKWSQVEAIERIERGEEVKGREVVRVVPIMDEDDEDAVGGGGAAAAARIGRRGDDASTQAAQAGAMNTTTANSKKSQGPHKLILQDAKGMNVTAFEMVELNQVFIGEGGINIGCKILLRRGTLVRRGMMMLTPDSVVMMGGKIESWDKKWREDRKKRMIAEVEGLQIGGVRAG